jgi:hypothetical protein
MNGVAVRAAELSAFESSSFAGLFRHSRRDSVVLGAALVVSAAVPALAFAGSLSSWAALPAAIVFGALLCWCSNTLAHIHLHTPIFRDRRQNRAFSWFLTLALGIPQTTWKRRHLAHHANRAPRPASSRVEHVETVAVAALFITLAALAPRAFFTVYLPGWALGLLLCRMQGHYEHAMAHGTSEQGISHYGRLHNFFWLNDGYHVEHHRHPGEHWTRIPSRRVAEGAAPVSALPPHARFLLPAGSWLNRVAASALCALERAVLGSPVMQRFVLSAHVEALRLVLAELGDRPLRTVTVVGGGLFPRTALALRALRPDVGIRIVDASSTNIDRARAILSERGSLEGITFVEACFVPMHATGTDLVILPLAYVGDRDALYGSAGSAPVAVHDWIWRVRGDAGFVVSAVLFKRLNLVLPAG